MVFLVQLRDHILLGGPNAVAGWGLAALLIVALSFSGGQLVVDPTLFIAVLTATLLTGMGIYDLNAYYDREADKINKPNRPIPSGRMTPEHALKFATVLLVSGMLVSVGVSIVLNNYMMVLLWSLFTLIGVAYSVPPVKLKSRHILGNFSFGAFMGVTVFIGMVLQQAPMASASGLLVYALLVTLSIAGLITMKDFYDTEGDRAAGDITLPVKIGKKWAATISIILIAIPLILSTLAMSTVTFESFIESNFWTLIFITSFVVYIALDYSKEESLFSDPYARVQYYFVILLAAYSILKEPLGISWGSLWLLERLIIVALYVSSASFAVYKSWKGNRDILKPIVHA